MSIVTSFSLGFSLSMDAFAASIAQGAQRRQTRWREALRVAFYFGALEAVLPLVGWTLGLMLGSVIAAVDHWIAFAVLLGIGTKMIFDVGGTQARPDSRGRTGRARLLLLALGTSIDAAAVGVPLLVMGVPIVTAVLIIGATTFAMTCLGFMLGGMAGKQVPRYAEGLGGCMLIGIGTFILLEHTGLV
ncbi:manganese efflux pump MntP family protein [Salinisphaera sp. T31B1]|uniref:manganese efflux pump MntP n=1 Tax=Salinisphaera sp. T31B1 TaxID=727963 RepID=UPI003341C78F